MKLFFTILGAVLAAAAIIWAVSASLASREKSIASELSILESSARIAKSAASLSSQSGKVLPSTMSGAHDGARWFERIIRERRVDSVKARSLAFNYVENWREVIKVVREQMPEHKKWADEMEPLLDNIEKASSRL